MIQFGDLPDPVAFALCHFVYPLVGHMLMNIYILVSVQWVNWEQSLMKNETCYVSGPRAEPCGQGRISEYSVVVESPEHIQQAVQFAQDNNLRLAIRNTGHDF